MSSREVRSKWLDQLLSTAPADRRQAEAAVRRLYRAAEIPEPRRILWFDSPFSASWMVALLVGPHHQLWSQRLSSGLSRSEREQLDRARSALGEALGIADVGEVHLIRQPPKHEWWRPVRDGASRPPRRW